MTNEILELLESSAPDRRAAGISQAGASLDPELVITLSGILRDPRRSAAFREAAAEALGAMRQASAHETLYSAMKDVDPLVRGVAAIGLGRVAAPAAVGALLAALKDDSNTVRNLAERSLLMLRDDVRAHGVDGLLQLLRHPAPLTRSPAARLIGLTGDPRALAPLLELLQQDRQWLVRLWAAKGLGDLGMAEATDVLAYALKNDEKNRVRAAAAEAIGKLRRPDAEALLRAAFECDPDGGVKKMAAEGLHALGLAGFGDGEIALDEE